MTNGYNSINLTYSVAYEISEDLDKFVLSTIQNGLYKDSKIIIPKKLILEALRTYKEEHPDRYAFWLNTKDNN